MFFTLLRGFDSDQGGVKKKIHLSPQGLKFLFQQPSEARPNQGVHGNR
jgi:hypothetical protein